MRLEERDDAVGALRAGGVDRGADLGRVVGVVVDDRRAVPVVPEISKRRPAPCEVARRPPLLHVCPGELDRFERGRRVAPVVRARHRERTPSYSPKTWRVRRAAGMRSGAHDGVPRAREKLAEGVVDVALGGVVGVVVELGVGHDRDRRRAA